MTVPHVAHRGGRAARAARPDHPSAVGALARPGLAAQGALYVIVGALALQLALGDTSGEPSQRGALEWLAAQSFGGPALWAMTVGLVALAAWRALQAWRGDPVEGDGGADRAGYAIKAVIFAVLAASAGVIAAGGGGGDGEQRGTAVVLGWPGGQLLVGLAGLGVAAYGVISVWRHVVKRRFEEQLDAGRVPDRSESLVVRIGQLGYGARGIVMAIAGALLVRAAVDYDAERPVGLSGALREVAEATAGTALLGALAGGLVLFGVFSLVLAWARRVA